MHNAALAANLWKITVLQILRWFLIFMPIVVVFYTENGLSMKEIMVLQAVYSLTMVLFEVPSGYFSDTIGRKNSLVLGTVLGTCGFAVYSVSYSLAGFLAAEIALGVGQSFISGTDSALLYDTLCELGDEEAFIKKQGRLTASGNFSEALAGIAGGFAALISLRTNFYIETAVMLSAVFVALSIREPRIHEAVKTRMSWSGFTTILKETVASVQIRLLLLYCSLLAASTLTVVWFVQPYLTLVQMPLALYGIIWTVLNLSVGCSSMIAYRIEQKLPRTVSLVLPLCLVSAGYFLTGSHAAIWSPVFFLLLYCSRGYTLPVFINQINRLVGTDRRATVLSVRVLLTRLMFVCIGPFSGWISDTASLRYALLVTGFLYCITGAILVVCLLLKNHTADR